MLKSREPNVYTRAERLSDGAIHVLGVLSALIAAPVLITLAAVWFHDRSMIVAVSVYCVCLVLMLSCSAIYHLAPLPNRRDLLRRFDQSAIYMKIAGSYTPFATLAGGSTGLLLAGIWTAAAAGVAAILFGPSWMRRASILLYLGIGWAGVMAGDSLFSEMTTTGFSLILAGGCLYTLGVLFFLWQRLPFHNTIWHVFVLAATAVVYCAVFAEIWGRSPTI